MSLHIDGTDEHGNLSGSALHGPFAVFDDEFQDWLITGLRFRWMAVLFIKRHKLKG